MRLSCLVLLATAFLLACTDAVLVQAKTAKEVIASDVPLWARSLTTEENGTREKRSLRRTYTDEEEERGLTIPDGAKAFGTKLKRLAKYNRWIFGNVKPEDVRGSKYYASYLKFYENRMVRGGKYA